LKWSNNIHQGHPLLKTKLFLLPGWLMLATCHADSALTLSTGFDYSSGKYGESRRTETLVVPVGIKYEFGDWTLRATIPYVESNGPSAVSGSGPDRVTIENGSTNRGRASGLGDIVVSAAWNAFQDGPWLIELAGKVKLATADEKSGLGTGENDYSVQTEIYRTLGATRCSPPSATRRWATRQAPTSRTRSLRRSAGRTRPHRSPPSA